MARAFSADLRERWARLSDRRIAAVAGVSPPPFLPKGGAGNGILLGAGGRHMGGVANASQ
jgi:hypothetical protein